MTTCDHLWPRMTTCYYLWLVRVTTCDYIYVTTCDHLRLLETTFDHLWQLMTCDYLWPLVTTCDNLGPLGTTCDYLWPLRGKMHHLLSSPWNIDNTTRGQNYLRGGLLFFSMRLLHYYWLTSLRAFIIVGGGVGTAAALRYFCFFLIIQNWRHIINKECWKAVGSLLWPELHCAIEWNFVLF